MKLEQAIRQVEEKERERQRLLGQKSMIIDNLKKLGYKDLKEAEKALDNLQIKLDKKNKSYNKKKKNFKSEFGHLLE